MKSFRFVLLLTALLLAVPASGQTWVVYSPPERDFRVLFPSPPVRVPAPDGSVAFRSQFEIGEGTVEYVVNRLPTSVQRVGNEEHEIRRLLQGRLGEDVVLRPFREEFDGDWQRYAFEYRRSLSVNRLVRAAGRYYHLEVFMPRNSALTGMQTARDFFASFQASGVSIPGLIAGVGQRLETWCQGRTDPFSRAFCQYSVCLQPGFEQNPTCTSLFRR